MAALRVPGCAVVLLVVLPALLPAAAGTLTDTAGGLLTESLADARWQWLDLWPKLLDIRRQFDRDGFPLQDEGAPPPAAAGRTNSGPALRTMELEDEDGGVRTAAVRRRLQHGDGPTPRDEAVVRTLGPLITPIANPQLSQECYTDSKQYLNSIFSQTWALRMFDATGKLPDGLLLGNVYPMGNWDECLNTTAHYSTTNPITGETKQHSFSGKYCTTYLYKTEGLHSLQPGLRLKKAAVGLAPIVPLLPSLGLPAPAVGICIPSSCSGSELQTGLNKVLNALGVTAFTNDQMCYTQDQKTELSPEAIVMITILSIVGFFMLVGTVFDVLTAKFAGWRPSVWVGQVPVTLRKVFTAFSVYTNGRKLLDTSSTKDTLSCLHGIRFFSMTWVILGHTYVFVEIFANQNTLKVYTYFGDWFFATIGNATVSVDSFFFLSGLLVAYIAMRNIERANGKLNIVMYYVHRYIRLTPVLMAVIGCVATLEPYAGSGPWWSLTSGEGMNSQVCRDNWWINMLYINNLVDMDTECIGQSWYLANDMQMFLFSPLILLPLYHWPVLGQLWLIFLICFFTGINAMVTVIHKLGVNGPLPDGDDPNLRYVKPWARAGPYLVGLYMGWVLHKIRGRKIILPAPVVAIGWLTASLTACTIIYGLYDQPAVPPQTTNVIYSMLNRTAWSVCLAWVVFACVTGYGGFVNSLLSWKALIPLSRLTYTSYLVSIDIQFMYWLGNKAPQYLDHTVLVYQFLGSLPIIFMAAIVFSLAFESPMLALEKLIFPQPSRAPPPAAPSKTADAVPTKSAEQEPGETHEYTNKTFDGDGEGVHSLGDTEKKLEEVDGTDADEAGSETVVKG